MMKNFILGIGITILVIFAGYLVATQKLAMFSSQKRTITVVGEGKVKMKPEVVKFTVGVSKTAGAVSDAMSQTRTSLDNVIAALKAQGISADDIKTTNYSVWPQYSQYYEDNVQKNKITGYQMSNDLAVVLRDVNKASEVLSKALEAGATNMGGVYFTADNPKETEAQARNLALENAYMKAQAMAEASKSKVGKIVSVTEGLGTGSLSMPTYYGGGGGAGGGGGPAIDPGQLEITQNVTVVYELQ